MGTDVPPASATAASGVRPFSSVAIDMIGNAADPYLIVPQSAGNVWITTGYFWRVFSNSGLSVAVVFNVGSNSSAYDNLVSGATIGGAFPSPLVYQRGPIVGGAGLNAVSVSTSGIYVHITTPAVGSLLSVQVILTGFYSV